MSHLPLSVKCTVGTFYNNSTKTCDDCPIGSYKEEEEADKKCTECPEGNTTETAGSVSSSDCIGKTLVSQQCYSSVSGSQQCHSSVSGTQQCHSSVSGSQQCHSSVSGSQQCHSSVSGTQQCHSSVSGSQQCVTAMMHCATALLQYTMAYVQASLFSATFTYVETSEDRNMLFLSNKSKILSM